MPAIRRTSRRRASAWMKAVLVILVVIFLAVLGLYAAGVSATHRWQRYADSLRAKGQPVTFLEIQPYRAAVPDALNGARVLEKLASDLEIIKDAEADRLVWIFGSGPDADHDYFNGLPQYHIEPTRAFVQKHRGLLDALNALRDMPTGRFDITYDPMWPIGTHLPSLKYVRNATKLERLATMVCLVDADIGGAVEHTGIQFRIAGTLHDEPILISRLVQIAIESQAVDTIEGILRAAELDETALTTLHTLITERIDSDTMKWALLGERAYFVDLCEFFVVRRMSPKIFLQELAWSGHLGWDLSLVSYSTALLRANQHRGTQMHTRLVETADDPQVLMKAAQQIDAEVPRLMFTDAVVRTMFPSLSRAMELHVKSTAQLTCARAALAAERFRLKNARLPDSLTELVPEFLSAVPIDPFDGQPMRFKTTDEGIVIFSVGENLIDDSGDLVDHPEQTGRSKRPQDVGFRLHRPDRRGLVILDVPPPADD